MRYPSVTSVSTGLLVGLVAGVLLTGTRAVGIGAAQNAPSYRAPRSAYGDGKPDLNGVWQALNSAYWDVEPHASGAGYTDGPGSFFRGHSLAHPECPRKMTPDPI